MPLKGVLFWPLVGYLGACLWKISSFDRLEQQKEYRLEILNGTYDALSLWRQHSIYISYKLFGDYSRIIYPLYAESGIIQRVNGPIVICCGLLTSRIRLCMHRDATTTSDTPVISKLCWNWLLDIQGEICDPQCECWVEYTIYILFLDVGQLFTTL